MCIIACSVWRQIGWAEIADAGDLLNTLRASSHIKLGKEHRQHQRGQQTPLDCFGGF